MPTQHTYSRRAVLQLAGVVALAGAVPAGADAQTTEETRVTGLRRIGRYRTGEFDGGAEIVAVAVEHEETQPDGRLAFYNTDSLELAGNVTVGSLPDKVALTPDGSHALSANEGEPAYDEPANEPTRPAR